MIIKREKNENVSLKMYYFYFLTHEYVIMNIYESDYFYTVHLLVLIIL